MDKKIQIIQLKILLVILEIFLVLLIWTLVQLIFKPKQEVDSYQAGTSQDVQEAFREQTRTEVKVPEPTPTPFVLTNIDTIRVVITNKETGDIYLVADVLGHKDVNTTRKHYAAMKDAHKRKAAKTVKLREP